MTTQAAIHPDVDAALARARAILDDPDGTHTARDQDDARRALELAGRGSLEWSCLRSLWEKLEERGRDRISAAIAKMDADAARAKADRAARRLATWREASPAVRAAFLTAEEADSEAVGVALRRFGQLLLADTAAKAPPASFAPIA